jgi:SAM-dependent methyltransferase
MSSREGTSELTAAERGEALYEAILGRPIDEPARAALSANAAEGEDGFSLALRLVCSSEFVARLADRAVDAHLFLIHRARDVMIRRLLPGADAILDLGGINAPLFHMGYGHPFKRMTIVDLPPDDRHAMYRDIPFHGGGGGQVSVHYCDMTSLTAFADASFDLVWSGQSIEHVDRAAGARMCREALRVLKPGGHFCLDTPNRAVTRIHTRDVGGGFIHPEHKHEYEAGELRTLLTGTGFEVVLERGVCEMPRTRETGTFHYDDFVLGNVITPDPRDGYILYFQCRKPGGRRGFFRRI